ncbi:hypothetical protein BGZ76_007271 [Entomortierella beljakovae]|nr:hypothetical protein BGZ76_007271 [Entomortierella beljakovae]
MASASLSIPIAFWPKNVSTSTISCTLACADYIVAGLQDGLIWVFKIQSHQNNNSPSNNITLQPQTLITGHNSRVTVLEAMLVEGDTKSTSEWILISASEDGEVKKWTLADGRCLQSNPDAFIGVPGYLGIFYTLEKSGSTPKFIVCAGTSNESCILDSTSLEVVRVWGGHQDWVCCTTLPSDEQHQSRILSVSTDCKLSLWVFDTASMTIVKAKMYDICINTHDSAVSLVACKLDPTRVALVTRNCVQVVCIRAQKKACHPINCPENDSFAGAEFISTNEILLWTESGHVFYYTITDEQQDTQHSANDSHSVRSVDSSKGVVTGGATQVCDWKLRLSYLPTVVGFRNNGVPYLLSLQNDSEGLRYSYANLSDIKTAIDGQNGNNAPTVIDDHVHWKSNSAACSSNMQVTYSVMLNDTLVAMGCNTGQIWVSQVDESLKFLASGFNTGPLEGTKVLKGHVGPITSIFTSDELMQRSFLITGGMDCSARIWNIESGTEVACFNNHSRPVAHFLQVPEDVNSRMRKCIISIAEDQSVAIISTEEMNCLYLFGGYGHELLSIQWRPPEDYIVLWYADGSAFVWQMQTGHLDRIVKGEAAREIIADPRWGVSEISHAKTHSSKLAFDCATIPLHETVSALTFTINLKHVINILSPARLGEQQGDINANPSNGANPQQQPPTSPEPRRRQRLFNDRSKQPKPKLPPSEQHVTLTESTHQCLSAAKAMLGLLVTEDDAHTISIRKLLDLNSPTQSIALGMKGAYGNISIQAPSEDVGISESWCISPAMTASKLIAILSLSKVIASVQNLGIDIDTWSKGYYNAVQSTVGPKFRPPSLSYLAKYWQDPQVPAAANPDSISTQFMARSAIILGILGAEIPEALPEKIRKLVALSLTILLNDDSRVTYKIASIDLLAQGFATWQPFIRADAVLSTLFTMSMDSQTNSSSSTLVSRRARRAIAQIATINSVLFVTTLTQDILDAKRISDKSSLLKLLSIFARKNPAVLYKGVPKLSEAIVKSLDPTAPQVREALLTGVTAVLNDFVTSFPLVDFHAGTQKLAVGTLEGAIIVYDLQTATRWQILEGHHMAVSAVSFSRDGKTIVSCSIKEGTVRFWHPNPGFFGMIIGSSIWGHSKSASTGSVNQTPQSGIPSLSSQQSSRTFDFALQDSTATESEETLLSKIRFEWTGDRAVKLSVLDHIMSFNV